MTHLMPNIPDTLGHMGQTTLVFHQYHFGQEFNDRGRFYNEDGQPNIVNPNCGYLNCSFNVSQGDQYRFRLIRAMSVFTYRFSIEGHSLTVVAGDGSLINSIAGVDYVIVNPGERYDVIVHVSNTEQRKLWIWAETLEDNSNARSYTIQ